MKELVDHLLMFNQVMTMTFMALVSELSFVSPFEEHIKYRFVLLCYSLDTL